jgi:uncharacterized membrane protein
MTEKFHGKKGYLKKIDNAEMFAMLQFKMPELVFCFKPNLIGLASLHMALSKPAEQPLLPIIHKILGLTPVIEQ